VKNYDISEVKSGGCVSKNSDDAYLFCHAYNFIQIRMFFVHNIYFKYSYNLIDNYFSVGYDCGGVMASSKREMELTNKKGVHVKEIHW